MEEGIASLPENISKAQQKRASLAAFAGKTKGQARARLKDSGVQVQIKLDRW